MALRPATVNRTITEPLRRVLNRARLWGEHLPLIEWRKHLLKEPRERIRELRADEEERLFAALRPDHHAIVRFALLTGCRIAECVGLRWRDVDWGGRVIHISRETARAASTIRSPFPQASASSCGRCKATIPRRCFATRCATPAWAASASAVPLLMRG